MNEFNDIVKTCRYLLQEAPEGSECLSYLNNRLDKEMQEKFSFGYFPNTSNLNLMTNFIEMDTLKKTALLYTKEIEDTGGARSLAVCFFEQQPLVLPYRDVYGNIIALVGRSLLSDNERSATGISKYKNTYFVKGNHVFGLYEAKEAILSAGFVYVVEGQFDVIKAVEQGLTNIVALGSADMSAYQFSLICRYTNNILLMLDNDEAGEKGRGRAISKYSSFANINNVYLPEGYKDIDEFLTQNSIDSMSLIMKDVHFV